ncbi:glutaredoxin domain-containing cysteine-rich protein 2 [Sphaerodactylus townsendi]|uniref:glutaredoxin domain-containing cysteine-rich protein 2 n=1 Tax=Sphaerodactylus townsendi TaxID=933632 RepID=UPI0020261EB0|nr:glutaredoxin domain-containing cysteine-rich protein 2 [Sphaerodactylus townsendi]
MDELQKKLNQRHDARPRKVRFKISSAYSGRVLKQVYEDGQELEIPQEEYPHRLRKCSFEPRDHLFGIREAQEPRRCPPAKLSAQRISVFREGSKYTLTSSPSLLKEYQANDNRRHPPILDFGKIIIYTSNLKIIRTSMNKKELVRKLIQNDSVDDWSLTHREEKGENSNNKSDGDKKDTGHQLVLNQDMQHFNVVLATGLPVPFDDFVKVS